MKANNKSTFKIRRLSCNHIRMLKAEFSMAEKEMGRKWELLSMQREY